MGPAGPGPKARIPARTPPPTLEVEVRTMTLAVIGGLLLLALIAVALFWPEPNGHRSEPNGHRPVH